MTHIVRFRLFQDDANGEYGLAHDNAIDIETPFNAFWTGQGLFHDVFEHWFENKHKYFKDEYSFNVGGEMAAMGASMYYYSTLGVWNRPLSNRSMYTFEENIRLTNEHVIQEAIESGYCSYGHTLESHIPKQSPVDHGELEYCISEMWEAVSKMHFNGNSTYKEDKQDSKQYKKSVTFRKIADLHRWGYRMAEKLVPDNRHNQDVCAGFIDYWNRFFKKVSASDLYDLYKYLVIRVYRKHGEIRWTATWEGQYYDMKDYRIQQHFVPCYEDMMPYEYSY